MKTFVVDVMHCRTVEIKADSIVLGAEIVTLVGKDGIVAAFPAQSLLRIFEKSSGVVDKG
jgi:hypothetical protein